MRPRARPRLRPSAEWITRLPPRTVRLRLTLLYGTLFLISGAVLLTITYLLVRNTTGVSVLVRSGKLPHEVAVGTANRLLSNSHIAHALPAEIRQARAQAQRDHATVLHQLLIQSGIALGIMAIVSIALGWLVAGRVLKPLRTMTAATLQISERNLHERLAIEGPRDELRDLADTVDGLLARLETAFGAQKRFVANAAHELRTPLTLLHALLEETLTDPNATIDSFRGMSRRLLALGKEQERLLEALLTLAAGERGLDHRQPFDLSALADEVLMAPRPEADRLGLQIEARIAPAPTTGDAALAQHLIANLVDNAVRYNIPGGRVQVTTGSGADRAFLLVANTGARIPPDQVERLFEPFQRLAAERTGGGDGHHGLGLSIVRAIATAHDASITTRAPAQGGLEIRVNFPLIKAHDALVAPADAPPTPDAEQRAAKPQPATPPRIAAPGPQ
jgi:signal transduction histidine kinase